MDALLHIEDLTVAFDLKYRITDALARRERKKLIAVDEVDLDLMPGDTLGLVGESGCGKTSLARAIMGLYRPSEGRIVLGGTDRTKLSGSEFRRSCGDIQMVFQDPYSSLNPRMTVRQMLKEELVKHRMCGKSEIPGRIRDILEMVGLSEEHADRYPSSFSGGQRQRICIARALALNPKIIVADEPVSALDVSIQAQILNLFVELQKKLNLTILFISHDLQVVRYISSHVAVMYLGRIMEYGEAEEIFRHPRHPYTRILLEAAPRMDVPVNPDEVREIIHGELPSPMNLPTGCRFHPRCPCATELCAKEEPLFDRSASHRCACHYPIMEDPDDGQR